MDEHDNLLGCFVSGPAVLFDASEETKRLASEQGEVFRTYIWGEKGISDALKKLKRGDYGEDLKLILFQFYVKPMQIELQHLKRIERYRKKEKAIGIPVCINDENFFNNSEEARYAFLKQSILDKLDLLAEIVKRSHLDTKMDLLKSDVQSILQ